MLAHLCNECDDNAEFSDESSYYSDDQIVQAVILSDTYKPYDVNNNN